MKRIIIADDSATARMFIKRCLQIVGLGDAEIIEAEDGKQALEAAKEQPADLLLTADHCYHQRRQSCQGSATPGTRCLSSPQQTGFTADDDGRPGRISGLTSHH